jgi:hypothetical protein
MSLGSLKLYYDILTSLFLTQTRFFFQGPALSSWTSLCFVASFFLYAIGYNLGVGPIAYFLAGELVPPEAVAPAMGCAVGVNWLATLLTTLLFYPVNA